MNERCTFCNHDGDVNECCPEHPNALICGLCRKARQGSKYPHRLPKPITDRPLAASFPARFWGEEFRARLDALTVTTAKATPCTVCGRLMIAAEGSTHTTCATGEIPTREHERVPTADLAELVIQGLNGVLVSEPWLRGVERAQAETEGGEK